MRISKQNPTRPTITNKLVKKRDRREYTAQRYQAKKQEYHKWYLQRKAQQEQQEQTNQKELYQANSIQILLSLKEYSELNREKKKLWYDFAWTFADCQKNGFFDIVQIQQLEQVAGNLAQDYYQTAKAKSKSSWNSLSEPEQSKLIKYWGAEKARKEQELAQSLQELESQGKEYEKELEMAKFHEERGKFKCDCWQCAEKKQIQAEIKEKLFNDQEEPKKEIKSECGSCFEYKQVDTESGLCQKCGKN